jgi:hypothetical protein
MRTVYLYDCRRCKERFEHGATSAPDPAALVEYALGNRPDEPAVDDGFVPPALLTAPRCSEVNGGVGDLVGWRTEREETPAKKGGRR